MVWYLSYGSNLSRARFLCYIKGGTPEGSNHSYAGCRDKTPPKKDYADEIEAELYFGYDSPVWGGGVAFIKPGEDTVLARRYLISAEQFVDVVAQENGLPVGKLDIEIEDFVGSADILPTRYGKLVLVKEIDGVPVFTFTSPNVENPNNPSKAYLGTIVRGLLEKRAMKVEDVARYFYGKEGVEYSFEELVDIVTEEIRRKHGD